MGPGPNRFYWSCCWANVELERFEYERKDKGKWEIGFKLDDAYEELDSIWEIQAYSTHWSLPKSLKVLNQGKLEDTQPQFRWNNAQSIASINSVHDLFHQ